MSVIKQLAEDFIQLNRDYYTSEEFLPKARRAAHEIDSQADRAQFLSLLLEDQVLWITDHRKGCKSTQCSFEKTYPKNHYFLNQEMARLGVKVDEDAFTVEERDAMRDRLDQILSELEQIKEGQGIVAQDVEDLKDLMYLGKRKWKRQFAGTVGGWVAAGIVSEVTAKPLVGMALELLSELPPIPLISG